jgi:uncharacterized protein (DUF362 family)/NAD-dependent dihydropyrimidine dehydrogenase PreA subunit
MHIQYCIKIEQNSFQFKVSCQDLQMKDSLVTVQACQDYYLNEVRNAIKACLKPLGGMMQFVKPGMKVLLKPNLLSANTPDQFVTTHPMVVQAVAELVKEAGGIVWIGDSPNSSVKDTQMDYLWRRTGMADIAKVTSTQLVPFKGVSWTRMNDYDYFIAKPITEADLVINLPKLKTHTQTLYTGAIKNLFGVIPGARKSAAHIHAPGMKDFSRLLVDVLELVHPGLTILDGVTGLEGNGPAASGTPHSYRCIAASADPVAMDAIMTHTMGYRKGEVLHLAIAGERNLGNANPEQIQIEGDPSVLNFGRLQLPTSRWFFSIPSWLSAPVANQLKLQPRVNPEKCTGCGTCSKVCPANVITKGKPPLFRLVDCIGCMCCGESCPEGAITPKHNPIARMVGMNG